MIMRDAEPGDRAEWLILWQGFLDHYRTTLAPAITAHTWDRLMDPTSPMKMRVSDDGGLEHVAINQLHIQRP